MNIDKAKLLDTSKLLFGYLNLSVLIIFLIAISLSASILMIVESAQFYARFYPKDFIFDSLTYGFITSILIESFLLTMTAVWFPKYKIGKINFWHPANFFIKSLMVLLFCMTVGGATSYVIKDKLVEIQDQVNRNDILIIRQQQLLDSKKTLDVFIGQNQKFNTAIAAKELAKVQEELITLKSQVKSNFNLWLDVILLFFIRFSLQIANMTCVWLVSRALKPYLAKFLLSNSTPEKTIENTEKTIKNDEPQIKLINYVKQNVISNNYTENSEVQNNLGHELGPNDPKQNASEINNDSIGGGETIDNKKIINFNNHYNPSKIVANETSRVFDLYKESNKLKESIKYLIDNKLPNGLTAQLLCDKLGMKYQPLVTLLNSKNTKWDVEGYNRLASIHEHINNYLDNLQDNTKAN